MNVEIKLRLGSAALSRQTHKQVTFSEHVVRIPVQVIFINIKVSDILLSIPLQAAIHDIIEITIQLTVCHNGSLLFNLLIVIYDLIHVDVILIVAIVIDNELAGNCGHNITQRSLDERKQKVCVLFRHWQIQAKIIF